MPIRLGEMLIKAGMITHTQLDEALKGQVIFGGRLGTNLIEMGVIGEEELARVLSEKLRVPCVGPDELMAVPDHLLTLVPRDMVERYKIVPLGVDGRRLRLVMADPSDLPAIDEIAFRTGFVIVPMVAPEIRLFMALEKYYGIRREVRALPVSETLGGRRVCTYGAKRPAEQLMRRDVVDFSTLPGNGTLLPWEGATPMIIVSRRPNGTQLTLSPGRLPTAASVTQWPMPWWTMPAASLVVPVCCSS